MKRIFLLALFTIALLLCLPLRTDSQRRRRGATSARTETRTQTASEEATERIAREQLARPLSVQEQKEIAERLLGQPRISSRFREQRVRVLSVKAAPVDKDAGALSTRRAATVIVFNYTQGNATRFIVDAESGEPLSEETLRGRPQASPEEKEEARDIIRRQGELTRLLLRENAQLEGGFIVDDPRRANTRNRFIQFQILSPDRRRILQQVVVDLTERRVAYTGQD